MDPPIVRTDHDPAMIADLARALAREVDGEVHFDPATRAMYSYDASHYRHVPIGYVAPRHTDALEAAVGVCRRHGAAVLMRGGGTSLAGQGCNRAVVIDTTRYLNRIRALDPAERTARVEPGVVLDDLQAAARPHGLCFGPDPSTHGWCTLGGMIANNAAGVHSLTAGKTVENVHAMRVLTYDGHMLDVGPTDEQTLEGLCGRPDRVSAIYGALRALRDRYADLIRERYPQIPRRVSGYNLDELLPERGFHLARALVGTEGTCAIMTEATVRLVPSPPHRALVVLGYGSLGAAGDAVPGLLEYEPTALEGMGRSIIDNMRAKGLEAAGIDLLPPGGAWLFVEFGGDSVDEATDRARRLTSDIAGQSGGASRIVLEDPAQAQHIWLAREAGLGASGRLADGRDTEEGWEDAAVDPSVLGDYLRDFARLLDRHGYDATQYGHFGQGLVHNRIDFRLGHRDGVARYRAFVEEAADLVVSYGGSLSGEHGDGQSRAELLDRMFGRDLVEAFAEFKAIWDPAARMNPGKVVAPRPLDADLKLGPDYEWPHIASRFAYPADDRSFARAVSRCVGVGKCRRTEGGTMCPSYMVTRAEQHSTRGRAHLLYEMAHGRLPDGWANDQVHQALELCLSCKGCKSDCPAGVDVATYKAEFLWHYHQQRRRPLHHYAFGYLHRWAALGAAMPTMANTLARLPMLRRMAGVAPKRRLPRLAPRTFTRWFRRHERHALPTDRPRVILWPDEFNDYFEPNVLRAGLDVLEHAGFDVRLPPRRVVSGRAMYDFGLLDPAKRLLERALDTLGDAIEAGTPIVGLEPSCVAVFRDELVNLMPDDPAAARLRSQTFTLAELLDRCPDYNAPRRFDGEAALFHGHCHHKSLMGTAADVKLLRATGLDVQTPDTGCCGMAGSFGYRAETRDLAQAVGERSVLPAARDAGPETRLVTDGFSCREQVHHATQRRPQHLAQVLADAHRRADEAVDRR